MGSKVNLASKKAALPSRLKLLPSFNLASCVACRLTSECTYSSLREDHLRPGHIAAGYDRGDRSTGLVNLGHNTTIKFSQTPTVDIQDFQSCSLKFSWSK